MSIFDILRPGAQIDDQLETLRGVVISMQFGGGRLYARDGMGSGP